MQIRLMICKRRGAIHHIFTVLFIHVLNRGTRLKISDTSMDGSHSSLLPLLTTFPEGKDPSFPWRLKEIAQAWLPLHRDLGVTHIQEAKNLNLLIKYLNTV
jgi:hypothetical protein